MTAGLKLLDETELPSGWAQLALGTLRQVRSRTFSPAASPRQTFELYSVPSHQARKPERVAGSEIGSTKQFVSHGDVLISKINPRLNRTWVVGKKDSFEQIASTEWIVFERCEHVFPRFLAYTLQTAAVRDYLSHNASGVGGSLTLTCPPEVPSP